MGGFYGAVLLQHERMAQPRRVYSEIYKKYIPYKSPLLKGDVIEDDRGIQLNDVRLTRNPSVAYKMRQPPLTREAKKLKK